MLTCREKVGGSQRTPLLKKKEIMMSQKAIHTWLNKSNKGDKITYYRGYLCDPFLQPIAPTNDRDRVKKLGSTVYSMADAGLLLLVQKKHADFDYEYIAIRT